MNTKVIVSSFVIIAGLLVGFVLLKGSTSQPTIPSGTTAETDAAMAKGVLTSRYLPYSDSTFALRKKEKRVLYFHAPWCPICRPTDKELSEKMDQIPAGVVVFKTDYDSSTDLKKKYAITYQHTFVLVDPNGNEIKKWNGGGVAEIIKNTQ